MSKNLKTKWLFILAITLISVYGIIGLPKSPKELTANLKANIRLGLDLRGGSQLVLQVQVQDAFKSEADQAVERLRQAMGEAGIKQESIERNDPATLQEADSIAILIKGVPLDKTGAIRSLIADRFPQWVLTSSAADYRLNLKTTEALALRRDTVERSLRTIENRINGMGLTEPTVQQRGRSDAEAEILVQMPGVDDPARMKAILQTAALLEISEVLDGPFPSREQALANRSGVLPLNSKLVREVARGATPGESWYLLKRTPEVTGRDLRNARSARDEFGKWETEFTLSQDRAKDFGRFTEANIGKRLAIVLDSQVRSAPTIQARIEDSGRITNIGNEQEASDLALILRAGSLPASIVYLQETTIGPSLGADSIREGLVSGAAGMIAVVAIMLVYYKKSGINATLALILNALILIAVLSYFDAVLTLPGIAGVILTIGMAVDSNVLVFERIREELRAGKAIPSAIDAGFSRAFLTIIDTHVTTIVSCGFLFIFGTGAVKGFAVTLVIGLIANVFTAVFVSKAIFEWGLARRRGMTSLSI